MGRNKDAYDWLLTWSPAEPVEYMPDFISEAFEKFDCSRLLAVIEQTGELHILFSTVRKYNSDYKWWKSIFGEDAKPPAFDLKYHDNFCGCIGYLLKAESTRVLKRVGISDEQIAYGKEQYARGIRRQRVRGFIAKTRIVHPRQFDAVLGSYLYETQADKDVAIREMARDGFVFAGSGAVETSGLYCDLYRRDCALQSVRNTD